MKESNLNLLIKKNFVNQGAWSDKIHDPAGISATMASPNPFDLFGYSKEFNFTFESKLIKNEVRAFQYSAIKSHQIANLSKIREITKQQSFPFICAITLGIWIPRKGTALYIFDIDFVVKSMGTGKKSVSKKELLKLQEQEKYILIKQECFDINDIPRKIIHEL